MRRLFKGFFNGALYTSSELLRGNNLRLEHSQRTFLRTHDQIIDNSGGNFLVQVGNFELQISIC
jgi:hypothetical protein